MKFYKLLFLFFALVGLNSCVEYVDNGKKNDGSETPEEKKFTAEHSNPDKAKYVGDTFEFKAMINNTDVTSSTKFKVNGSEIKGNTYIAFKEGENSVVATMDNYTANFKFKALKKDDTPDPEPKGNRIEYEGKSYPVSETVWIIHIRDGKIEFFIDENDPSKEYTLWMMSSSEYDNNDKIVNSFTTYVYVPIKSNGEVAFPNESTSSLDLAGGSVIIDGKKVFDINKSLTYNFASTGNTVPPNWSTQQAPWMGKANLTSEAEGKNKGEIAKLFWNGDFTSGPNQLLNKPQAKSINKLDIKKVAIFK